MTPGSSATVTINGKTYPVTVNADGTYSYQIPDKLPDGTYKPVINVTQNGATTSTDGTPFTIDTTPPAAPLADVAAASDTGSSSTDNNTGDNTPTFAGTGSPGDTITIKDGTTVLGTAVVDGSGNWTFTAPASLTDGVHQITTTVTDTAGNTSAPSPALAVTIDTTVPANPYV